MSRPHGLHLVRNHRRICPAELAGAADGGELDREAVELVAPEENSNQAAGECLGRGK
jgi:hypothetical protein